MTIQKMGLTETDLQLSKANFIIDAMIGYGLQGKPRPPVSGWITKANQSRSPILALDAPTGLDATTGKPATYCIKAKATMTLAMPKMGLLTNAAQPYVGDLYLADIGVPPELYQSPTLSLNIENNPHYFDKGCIIKLY
jgi:NAD(P)H-hydrate epimerase